VRKQQIRHGGDLENAILHYRGEAHEWLDLSTGISPWSYPIPQFDESTWRTLPYADSELIAAASAYYKCAASEIAITPGSQLAIRLLPLLLKEKRAVAIPLIGYQEHANSWKLAGHEVIRYRNIDQLNRLLVNNVVSNAVVINPNNPTAERLSDASLQQLSATLHSSALDGLLIVDQAFSDLDAGNNAGDALTPLHRNNNVVILKSIGKFFGLAGARLGFAIGVNPIVNELQTLLSPWSVAGPSMHIATLALSDTEWQGKQVVRINQHARQQRLALSVIKQSMPNCQIDDQSLFFSIFDTNDLMLKLHKHLAQKKIWARLGDPFVNQHLEQLNWLRLSLAGDHLERLSAALMSFSITADKQTTLL
jgi:cobalamin biosynthetic protein CobC